jgi:hypothetical protein
MIRVQVVKLLHNIGSVILIAIPELAIPELAIPKLVILASR